MNDIIEVTGYFSRTPTIRFVQKGKGVTNIAGEKLYEHQVTTAVGQVLIARGLISEFFVMLADVENFRYTLCVEHVSSLVIWESSWRSGSRREISNSRRSWPAGGYKRFACSTCVLTPETPSGNTA